MTNHEDPAAIPSHDDESPAPAGATAPASAGATAPSIARLGDAAPHGRVVSNGRYWSLVTGAGTGLSQCGWFAVTRWAGDRVSDQDGVAVYLRDLDSGEAWSVGSAPIAPTGGTFFARSAPGVVTFGRRAGGIEAACEVIVASDADGERRRLQLRNRASARRRIEVTFLAEVVCGHRGADDAHPAFAKLFVETAADGDVLTARRRPRGRDEAPLWCAAALSGPGTLEFETDRCRFIGRGRSTAAPAALATTAPLGATTGSVLDPVFAMRRVVELDAGAETTLVFALAAGTEREDVAAAVRRLSADVGDEPVRAAAAAERARRRRFGLSNDDADLAQELGCAMLYAHPALAAPAADRLGATPAPPPAGIPGDALLVVAPVRHAADDAGRARSLASMLGYLRELGPAVALALLCEEDGCDGSSCAHAGVSAAGLPLAVVAAAVVGAEAAAALRARARWLALGSIPSLADGDEGALRLPKLREPKADASPAPSREKLQLDNGWGAFSADGREYVVRVGPALLADPADAVVPPMPWSNIVANEACGFLATESGAGYAWAGNSRQNKLTPWSNDPVSDPHGEALYVRDHASGRFWSPLPGPAPSGAWTEVRHGMGWTRWIQRSEALEQEVTAFVAGDEPARLQRVRLSNRGSRERRLSLVAFSRLVLGVAPNDVHRVVVTGRDDESGVLLASNRASEDHAGAVAFAAVVSGASEGVSWTTDRASFLGRGRTMAAPRAVAEGVALDGRAGADALDPCFAFEVPLVIPPRGEVEVVLALGQAGGREEALGVVARLREAGAVDAALAASKDAWRDLVTAVEVETPSKAVDLMLGGWLLYQALGCRIRARSAYYQSGGAYGFRDQLQDASALVYARPDLFRAQIVLHAGHQFTEGDVMHWWHPGAPRGTRTRFSDDLLWLPYLAATYIGVTGDESVLDEKAPFVSARALAEGEDETYLVPTRSEAKAAVYEHCCLAIDRSLAAGAHGLPLMGTGDWNDGMNRVGREGRGESVWMAFFLASTLDLFLPLVEKRADWERLRRYRQRRETLQAAIDESAWDGQWFRRAYYDDGAVLGSAASDECRIDAIAQAWAVMSGTVAPERARTAMASVERELADEEAGIIRLLWPPFDRTTHDPGYIKGYVPGIRENGGQYSHAAVWAIRALAMLGERGKAVPWFERISPVAHAGDRERAARYQVEPYVLAADIYGAAPHVGRGGWTWYTGSAAWMYRTGLESLLGIRIEEGRLLRVRPCIPDSWPRFRVKLRLPDRRTVYDIEVENPTGRAAAVVSATMGAVDVPVDKAGARIVLRRDGKLHKVKVVLG